MSAEVFNRISRLEAEIAALKARLVVLELAEPATQSQVRESERPSKPTLSLRTKGEPSRA